MQAAKVTGSHRSLFYKTLAIGLRPFLSGNNNLAASRRAIFVAVPFTDGIPEGDSISQEVTNEMLFRTADAIQDIDSPVFGFSRLGSYFDSQYQYLLHLKDDSELRFTKAQSEVTQALAATKAAYASDIARYKALLASNPDLNFVTWMNQYAFQYNVASDDLKYAQSRLAKSRSEPMSDVQGRLESMSAARSMTNHVVGSNMPATLVDQSMHDDRSSIVPQQKAPSPRLNGTDDTNSPSPTPTSLFRPLHYLSNYQDTVASWVQGFQNGGQAAMTMRIGLDQAAKETWASLGFKQFDGISQGLPGMPTSLVPSDYMPANISDAEVANIVHDDLPKRGPDRSRSSPRNESEPFQLLARNAQMSIKASGIRAFDIFRGLWNIDNIRSLLPGLLPTAPASVANPFLKTTRLLLGYGVEIALSVPTSDLKSLGLDPHGRNKDISSVIGDFLAELDTPAIESSSLMYSNSQEAVSTLFMAATESSHRNKGPKASVNSAMPVGVPARTTIWRMSSQDNATPVLLAALAIAT